MGENDFAQLPVALYGIVLWMSALDSYILTRTLVSLHGTDSILATALGRKIKEISSLIIDTAAIVPAFMSARISMG
jgi:TMEM175 potassium channel family protein